jgi:hypothetical protein
VNGGRLRRSVKVLLKPRFFFFTFGTAEAVPFQNGTLSRLCAF